MTICYSSLKDDKTITSDACRPGANDHNTTTAPEGVEEIYTTNDYTIFALQNP